MPVTLFMNQKGGVGKTTLATNAAFWYAEKGQDPLLIDADPQGTAGIWASVRGEPLLPVEVISLARDNMARQIRAMAERHAHIIIDGPPRADRLARAAIMAADRVFLPIEPANPSAWSVAETISMVREAQVIRPDIEVRLVVNRVQANTEIARLVGEMVEDFGVPILETRIGNRTVFAKALSTGLAVAEAEPASKAAHEIDALMKEIENV